MTLAVSFFRHSSVLMCLFFLSGTTPCCAERIYYKDGTVAKEQVVSRSSDTLWIKQGPGRVGIDIDKIEKVENDDGSISQYGAVYSADRVRELIAQKDYGEAEKVCAVLLGGSPGNIELHYLHGMLSQKMGNDAKALEDYAFLVGHNSADARIFNNLGRIYARQKKYDEAAGMFDEAVKSGPDRPEFHNNLAELFMGRRDFGRAIEEYNKVIEMEPDNAQVLYNLGVAYKDKGLYEKAGEAWEKALSISPEDADAKRALEYLKKKA